MKLLVVDDDPDLLALVAFSLTNAGYAVVKAADTAEALRAFDSELPDLVILDINLPSGSGFDVCKAIRARSEVPVMMLTARGDEEDLVRALELGADDYLTKPFSPRTLLARVKALLRRAGIEQGDVVESGPRRARPRGAHDLDRRRARRFGSRGWRRGCCRSWWPRPATWFRPSGCWLTSGDIAGAATASS